MMYREKQKGFTIVELLIVIVVIAILAAISVVAYNGIQNRANDTAVQSDLSSIGKKIASEQIINDTLPVASSTGLQNLGLRVSKNSYSEGYNNGSGNYNALYCRSSDNVSFALIAWAKSGNGYVFSNGTVRSTTQAPAGSAGICSSLGVSGTVFWMYSNGSWATWL